MKLALDGRQYDIDEQYRQDLEIWIDWAVKHPSPQTANAQETITRARDKTGVQHQFPMRYE